MRKLIVLLLLLAPAFALAASADRLVSRMDVFRIDATADGRERAVAVDEILPGELLEYRLTYENVSEGDLRALVITGPVPQNTDYVADSARTEVPVDLVVSIDGGGTYEPEPVVRTRTGADGSVEEFVVPAEQYTHVRWRAQAPLAAGATQEFRYRVVVE